MRSPFAPVVLSIVALLAALARWQIQGSHNVYTAISKRFYIPDPDLGWQVSPVHPVWVGLEICAVIAAIAVGLAVGGWIIRRREAKRGQRATGLRAAAWLVAAAPLIVPIWAFASGGGPRGGLDTLPASTIQGIEAGITGMKVSAGHETFDARFAGGIRGSWQGDPHDLTRPVAAQINVDAAGVDTGIDERSSHAREAYLHADQFPKVTVALDRVLAAGQQGANTVGFRVHGTLGLIGKTHSIEITGTLKRPDAAALQRLNLSGDVLLVQADFAVLIKDTALASDAKDFDGDRIPIHVSLVMRHTSG
ncbi:MAG: YceI family protein [Deltaproteobacteria bacterium]|nr:MAG: YceI family protein [Deltaproteobacteria bacterium]